MPTSRLPAPISHFMRRVRGARVPAVSAVLLNLLLPALPVPALLPLPPIQVHAQAGPLAGLDDYITGALPQWEVPGLAIAVIRNDSLIYARGFGVRELGGSGAVDEHTMFAIASTTKAMTVAALGMLVDEEQISWDDRVSDHLPAYQLADPFIAHELTIRDLLTHRSGISRSDNLWIAGPFDRTEVLRRARYLPASSGFRSEYGYHNVMYIAAGELVGAVSGLGWDDFLQQRLFHPLDMSRTTTRATVVETRDNVSSSHTMVDGRVQVVERRNYDNIGGAGAVFSSVRDLAQWLRLQLNDGTYEGIRLISPAVMREMHMPQTVIRSDTAFERLYPNTNLRAYALGWNVQDYHGRKLVHHSGSLNWTRTQIGMVPSEGIGVVVIANLSTSNLQAALMYRVLDALMVLPARDWSAELLEPVQRGRERSAEAARETERSRIPDTRHSLALAGYAGTYTSDLYGDARLSLEDGRLVLHYAPDYIADLEHWHHDTFRANWRRPGFGRAFLTFALDHRARAVRMDLDGFGEFRRAERDMSADR
ncbi:MAG: serine hydrolase [Gemmatimonadetes bacterium]|nr:serine hydrolase [Gemmatimonadota bacterium]